MDDLDQDNGSLFGSPPASPLRAATPPGPVLPGSANVGSIALAGAHNHAELDMRFPAAASTALSAPQQPFFHSAPRAPALHKPTEPRRSSRVATRGGICSTSIAGPSSKPRSQQSRRKRGTRPETAPPPLKIPLPSSGESTPLNFFRNQPALLGHAGVIGGVQPAHLPQPHAIGRTREDPISLSGDQGDDSDEENDINTETLGPTQAQVLQALVKDREAVGTLTEILRLAAENKKFSAANTDEHRPTKRRRTALVSDGSMQSNQARLKRMISRLVVLIQEAARRATRDLVMQRTGHYRPITASYGQLTQSTDTIVQDEDTLALDRDINDTRPRAPSQDSFGDVTTSAFDDFMASLTADGVDSPFNLNSGVPNHSASTETPLAVTSGDDLNLDNLDHLLELLQTLPQGGVELMQIDPPIVDAVAPSLPAGWEIDPALLAMDPNNVMAGISAQAPSLGVSLGPVSSASTPGMIGSPMSSATSPVDPATPQWDTLFPDSTIQNKDTDLPSLEVQGEMLTTPAQDLYSPMVPVAPPLEAGPILLPPSIPNVSMKNLGVVAVPNPGVPSTFTSVTPLPLSPVSIANPHLPPPPVTLVSPRAAARQVASARGKAVTSKPEPRSSVLKRATDRKKLLETELERAKVELWEATIEAGTLTHLLKAGFRELE